MRFGVTAFLTDLSIPPTDLAREAEARGFDGIYIPEHTHIPTSRATPAPMGEPLPEQYRRCLDPFVALTAAATVTTTLRLGTGICLVAQRDPIVTAKEVASLDHLSGGRFVFGIGFGWNVEEMADHGVEYTQRRDVVRDKVLAMKALWTQDEATHDGTHARISPSWQWPKPAQRPHPPVLIGGAGGPKMFDAVAEYADGWIPIGGRGIKASLPDLARAAEARGRDPETISIMPFGSIPEPGKIEYFASLGITDVVLGLDHGTRDALLPQLDAFEKVVAPYRD